MRKGTIKVIDPGKRTTAAMGTKPSDWFVPGWDKGAGSSQHTQRLDERERMGQKKTPVGRTRLRPAGHN